MKQLKLFAFATLLSSYCFGQWVTLPPNGATGGDLEAIWCLDTATCIAVGSDGIFKTTDGAQSWVSVSPGDYQFDVYFVNNMIGYTVGDNAIGYKTNDGGNNWATISTSTTNPLTDICFVNTSTGYAIGTAGTILKTTDGGNSWSLQSSPVISTYNAINVPVVGVGYIVGDGAVIIKGN